MNKFVKECDWLSGILIFLVIVNLVKFLALHSENRLTFEQILGILSRILSF